MARVKSPHSRVLYTKKYLSLFYFCPFCPRQWPNLRPCQFQCLKLHLFKHNCVCLNSNWVKTLYKCRRAKITWNKNNPVYSIYLCLDLPIHSQLTEYSCTVSHKMHHLPTLNIPVHVRKD